MSTAPYTCPNLRFTCAHDRNNPRQWPSTGRCGKRRNSRSAMCRAAADWDLACATLVFRVAAIDDARHAIDDFETNSAQNSPSEASGPQSESEGQKTARQQARPLANTPTRAEIRAAGWFFHKKHGALVKIPLCALATPSRFEVVRNRMKDAALQGPGAGKYRLSRPEMRAYRLSCAHSWQLLTGVLPGRCWLFRRRC